jgi:hypothetical protein
LYPPRAPHKLAATVRALEAHRFGASRAERAFVTADECIAARGERRAAFLARSAHLECHAAIFSELPNGVERL